ncbi:MAG: STAS-like domain-containing protein [Bacteroidetes bacterium]|nr:STAS-like domain-containing protein [Bacteroidota bacterium]
MSNSTIDRGITIYVRKFTLTPGPRLREDGAYSGEEFRERHLLPKYREAVKKGVALHVVLEGTKGYASSFLEEAFGGLVRKGCKKKEVSKYLKVHSSDRPWYEPEVYSYIDGA